MHRVLVITAILPVPDIEYKKTENDIILITEEKILAKSDNVEFGYIFIFPYANRLLAFLSKKWSSYRELRKKRDYSLRGRSLFLTPLLLLPKRLFFRHLLVEISLFFQRRRIEKLIQEFKPSLIHAQGADASASVARILNRKYNIPYIVTLRDIQYSKDTIVRKNLASCEKAIAISPLQYQEGSELTNKAIEFIPHGIEGEFFNVNRVNEIANKCIRLIVVARLLKLKNIEKVIKVLLEFKYDFEFDIYGDGPERQRLNELIRELKIENKIRLKGFMAHNNLPEIYKNYNVFVMPSFPETLGRVYFEALASGLPVIAARNTGVDGLISEGKEGFLLDVYNHDSFKKELLSSLEMLIDSQSLLSEMSLHARDFARGYLWDNIVPKYLDIYEDI